MYEAAPLDANWAAVPIAQVSSYKGLIFATFDPDAPSLVDYLGDMASVLVFQAELPSVLREWAILSFARGRTRRGRWLLAKALRVARRRDCGGEVAACLFVAAAARGAKGGGRPAPPSTATCADDFEFGLIEDSSRLPRCIPNR